MPLGQVKVAGKAFDAEGKLLGTATSITKPIERVKRHEVAVVDAPAKR